MATRGFIACLHITLLFFIQDIGTERSASLPAATAPGDVIIGGIFPIHEDVDRDNRSFKPHIAPCIR